MYALAFVAAALAADSVPAVGVSASGEALLGAALPDHFQGTGFVARLWGGFALPYHLEGKLALGYLAGLVEMLTLVDAWPAGWSAVTVSCYTLLVAIALLVAGFVRSDQRLRWPGLLGLSAVVVGAALRDPRRALSPPSACRDFARPRECR